MYSRRKKGEERATGGSSINPLYERRSKTGTINNSLPVLSPRLPSAFLLEEGSSFLLIYIYIHTRVRQAKSFVKTDLCLTTPKFRQISCVARHLAELCPPLSPSRGDELIESLIALFYLHLGKCYTSRCWLIIRGEKFPFVVSIQAAGFDPKGTVDKSIIKRKERGTR